MSVRRGRSRLARWCYIGGATRACGRLRLRKTAARAIKDHQPASHWVPSGASVSFFDACGALMTCAVGWYSRPPKPTAALRPAGVSCLARTTSATAAMARYETLAAGARPADVGRAPMHFAASKVIANQCVEACRARRPLFARRRDGTGSDDSRFHTYGECCNCGTFKNAFGEAPGFGSVEEDREDGADVGGSFGVRFNAR